MAAGTRQKQQTEETCARRRKGELRCEGRGNTDECAKVKGETDAAGEVAA